MLKINEYITLQDLTELMAPKTAIDRGLLVHQFLNDEIADIGEADFAAMRAFVLHSLADIGGQFFISTFAGFSGFFDWLDTAEHYENEDNGTSLAAQKPWLALVYRELSRNYDYTAVEQEPCLNRVCSICGGKVLAGQYRRYELPAVYVVEHRACSEHDPEWAVMDKAEAEKLVWRREYVAACREFQAKWNTDALDEEIHKHST